MLRGHTPQFGSLKCHHQIHIQHRSPYSKPHMASKSDSDSYHPEPTLFTAPSIPMDGVHLDPFQGGIVSSGLMSIPPIITGIPSTSPSGPIVTAHIGVGSIPTSGGPIPATVVTTIPPFIPGCSGPSGFEYSCHTSDFSYYRKSTSSTLSYAWELHSCSYRHPY